MKKPCSIQLEQYFVKSKNPFLSKIKAIKKITQSYKSGISFPSGKSKMALKKKNVFQGFMQDDHIPTAEQQIVKYVMGKGNNLHEVESPQSLGSTFLVSMPKKFRQTVWLKRGDYIVIDPINEGKKVLGEILCVIPSKSVVEMIKSGEWKPKQEDAQGASNGAGDFAGPEQWKEALINFFTTVNKNSSGRDSSPTMPPSDSEDDCSSGDDEEEEESGEEEGADEESPDNISKGQVKVQIGDVSSTPAFNIPSTAEEDEEEGCTSRVHFLTSGIVTVTNVVNDISSLNLQNELQSLDFETEDSSLESNQKKDSNLHREANTIRIQVNYPPESDKSSTNQVN